MSEQVTARTRSCFRAPWWFFLTEMAEVRAFFRKVFTVPKQEIKSVPLLQS